MRNWHFASAMGVAATTLRQAYDAGGGSGAPAGDGGGTDAGTGDDAGDGSDPGDGGDPTSDPEQAGRTPAGDGDGDDDPDELDLTEFADLEQTPSGKKLLRRLSKFQRRDKRHTPLVQAARALGIEKPEQLRELLEHGARGRAMTETTRERSATREEDPRDQPLPEDTPFDFRPVEERLAKAGWDLRDPLNVGMIGELRSMAQENHELRTGYHKLVNVMRVLSREVGGTRQSVTQDRQARENAAISSEVSAAAGQFKDKDLAKAFRKAVYADYQMELRGGQRPDIKKICAENLRVLLRTGQVTQGEAARVAAAQQRVADRNRIQPRSTAISGNGTPSGAPRVDRSRETLRTIHRTHLGNGFVGALGR